jgi:hypothetical protein
VRFRAIKFTCEQVRASSDLPAQEFSEEFSSIGLQRIFGKHSGKKS